MRGPPSAAAAGGGDAAPSRDGVGGGEGGEERWRLFVLRRSASDPLSSPAAARTHAHSAWMVPSSSGAGVAWAAKRGRGVALELSADPRPLAAAAAAPSESNPLRWGPPPLEPIPDMGPRDSVFAAAASEDEPTVEADAPARSTISLMPRCLAVARPKP